MSSVGLGTFVTYNPQTVSRDTVLEDVVRLMEAHGVRHLPLVDVQRQVTGVVSDLDVARAVFARRAWSSKLPGWAADIRCRMSDIILRDPVTIDVRQSPVEALQQMLANRIHCLPVVRDGQLIGIVTSTDFLREFSYGGSPSYRAAVSEHLDETPVEVSITEPLGELLQQMQQHGLEHMAVMSQDRAVGSVSLRQLYSAAGKDAIDVPLLHAGHDAEGPGQSPINSLRTLPSVRLGAAAATMIENRVRVLPVVDRHGGLVGLLTDDAILSAIADDLQVRQTETVLAEAVWN